MTFNNSTKSLSKRDETTKQCLRHPCHNHSKVNTVDLDSSHMGMVEAAASLLKASLIAIFTALSQVCMSSAVLVYSLLIIRFRYATTKRSNALSILTSSSSATVATSLSNQLPTTTISNSIGSKNVTTSIWPTTRGLSSLCPSRPIRTPSSNSIRDPIESISTSRAR